MGYVLIACRVLLGAVFLASSIGKLTGRGAWHGYRDAVRQLARVPERVSVPVAVVALAAEFAVVVLVAVPATVLVGFALAGVLLVGFTVALGWALARGYTGACHCFGRSSGPVRGIDLVRNAMLLLAVGTGLFTGLAGGTSTDGASTGGPAAGGAVLRDAATHVVSLHAGGVVVAACVGLFTALILVLLADLAELIVPSTTRTHSMV